MFTIHGIEPRTYIEGRMADYIPMKSRLIFPFMASEFHKNIRASI
jgi:hypothetical protein